MQNFTPTEQRMIDVLADGKPHRREELHACLGDELQPLTAIQMHICKMRKKLVGHDILCVARNRSYYYQHVRIISTAD